MPNAIKHAYSDGFIPIPVGRAHILDVVQIVSIVAFPMHLVRNKHLFYTSEKHQGVYSNLISRAFDVSITVSGSFGMLSLAFRRSTPRQTDDVIPHQKKYKEREKDWQGRQIEEEGDNLKGLAYLYTLCMFQISNTSAQNVPNSIGPIVF